MKITNLDKGTAYQLGENAKLEVCLLYTSSTIFAGVMMTLN